MAYFFGDTHRPIARIWWIGINAETPLFQKPHLENVYKIFSTGCGLVSGQDVPKVDGTSVVLTFN